MIITEKYDKHKISIPSKKYLTESYFILFYFMTIMKYSQLENKNIFVPQKSKTTIIIKQSKGINRQAADAYKYRGLVYFKIKRIFNIYVTLNFFVI